MIKSGKKGTFFEVNMINKHDPKNCKRKTAINTF